MKFLGLGLSSVIFALLLPAAALADSAFERQVKETLQGIEETATADEIRALGPDASAVLVDIANDTKEPVTTRARAIHALGWLPTEESRALLLSWARNSGEKPIFRRKAVYALGNGWGDAVATDLEPLFDSTDVQLKLVLVKVFSAFPAEKADPIFAARLLVETDATVRSALTEALK